MRENLSAFLRGFLRSPTKVEDMKMKLSCEACFKFRELKMWKRSLHERHPPNSKSWRSQIEAPTPHRYQSKKQKTLSNFWNGNVKATSLAPHARKISQLSCKASFTSKSVKTKLSCKASFQFQKLKSVKTNLSCKHPSNSESWRHENAAFVQGFLQI